MGFEVDKLEADALIGDAVVAAEDRLFNEECGSLFFTSDNNTLTSRKLLSDRMGRVEFTFFSARLASASNIDPSVPIYTADDRTVVVLQGRSFITGTLNGPSLGGAFAGLSTPQIRELMVIHELMHVMGLIGPDSRGQVYTLANGQQVIGSGGISMAIREHCFK